MVLLLRHLMCLVIESGFWFIASGVTIPVEVVCQYPARLFYQHLGFFREVLPVGSLQVLQLLSAEARRPLVLIAISSVVIGE